MIPKIPLNSLPRLAKTTGLPNAESSLKEISAQIKAEHGDTYTHVEMKDFLDLRAKYRVGKTDPSAAGVCSMLDAIIRAMGGEPVAGKSPGGTDGATKKGVASEANALINAAKPTPRLSPTSRVAESRGCMSTATVSGDETTTADGQVWMPTGENAEVSNLWDACLVRGENNELGIRVQERGSGKSWVIGPPERPSYLSPDPISFLRLNDAKNLLAGVTEYGFYVWDLSTGKQIAFEEGPGNSELRQMNDTFSFSPDGSKISCYNASYLSIWKPDGTHVKNHRITCYRPKMEWSEDSSELRCYAESDKQPPVLFCTYRDLTPADVSESTRDDKNVLDP